MNAEIDFDTRVDQYVRLRDLIQDLDEAHKTKMKPYHETLEKLNGVLLAHLNATKQESARAKSGTVYKKSKKSATVADRALFRAWVEQNGKWEMVDFKANAPAVENYLKQQIEEAKAAGLDNPAIAPPPGVNFSITYDAGVRRASTKKEESE
jgi:hypothetical protein